MPWGKYKFMNICTYELKLLKWKYKQSWALASHWLRQYVTDAEMKLMAHCALTLSLKILIVDPTNTSKI